MGKESHDNATQHNDEEKRSFFQRPGTLTALACVGAGLIILSTVLLAISPQKPHEAAPVSTAAVPMDSENAQGDDAVVYVAYGEEIFGPTLPPPPQPEWVHVDFSNSVLIGSSTTEALYIHDLLRGATYLYGTGLTVEDVMSKHMPGSSVTVIDELAGKNYNQVFLAFGLNELGWPDLDVFQQMYGQVIARVREHLPTAAIYVESVLPVSMEASTRNRFGVNQDRVNEFNAMLAQFAAANGVHFLDVTTQMKGPDGYLPAEASSDGIHPNLEWCRRWVALISEGVENILNAGTGATRPPDDPVVPPIEAILPPQPENPAPPEDPAAAAPPADAPPAAPEEAAPAPAPEEQLPADSVPPEQQPPAPDPAVPPA